MNKDLRLSRVLPIVLLAIILIVACLYVPALSILLVIIPVPFAIIGTLSNIKNNIISLVITFIVLVFIKPTYAVDILINSMIPGMIIGIMARRVLKQGEGNKYEPIFLGSIVFILSVIVHYFISKYILSADLLDELINAFNQSVESQKDILQSIGNNELLDAKTLSDTFRNIIPSILFFRGIVLSIIVYLVEIFTLKKMKYEGVSEIKFRNFYLPGNAILISFVMYLLMMVLSYINTPLHTDAIFLNLQMVFNFMFIIQGISVCIYFIKKWLNQGFNFKMVMVAFCVGIFGVMSISFIGMVDSILDFREVRICKSV